MQKHALGVHASPSTNWVRILCVSTFWVTVQAKPDNSGVDGKYVILELQVGVTVNAPGVTPNPEPTY